ncbi:MAG: bifunctional acetate--CoA ligase family protein/GNAT family N-acetyltransferase, partial [Phycisphaerales bacterium]|nr:bifunctional acetate--CoA ligase family protein/GNAT family N-acetyltransferase [Phycisphaerales bacterium]
VGSMLDVAWGDLIDYVGRDPHTSSILLYVESVGDARSFLSAARQVALNKPIIAIKAGRTEAASKAAVSHTGSLAGSAMIFDAAMERVGVLQVDRIAELFSMAEVLGKQPYPKGNRLTIVTNAGGPGVLATDALVEGGGELADLAPETLAALNEFLPPHWSRGNPIDVLGDGDAERFFRATEIAANDPSSDGLLVVLAPQDMTDPTATARRLAPLAQSFNKPILASWMGGPMMREAVEVLNQASIPTFEYPDTAARAFNYLQRYSANLRNLYETPALVSDDVDDAPGRNAATERIIAAARAGNRTLLTEFESKQLLSAYGIPTVETQIAQTLDEAIAAAERIGYPVVLKLYSLTVTHKTDVGGVELNLKSRDEVRAAYERIESTVSTKLGAPHFQGVTVQQMIRREGYELILGGTLDPQFGPVVMFGLGGQLVEVFRDRSFGLPPLNETLARRMMKQTKIYKALEGVRGKAGVDIKAVEKALIEFARMLVEQPCIKECDINPLLATPNGVVALDARVVLHDSNVNVADLPQPAIRPYPVDYVRNIELNDATPIRLRPIRLEDEPAMVEFHQTLSEETVRRRYFQMMHLSSRTDHDRLVKICYNDYDRELVLVADRHNPQTNRHEIIGVARLSRHWRGPTAEFAILLSDAWQHRGLGTQLLGLLIDVGRQEGIRRLIGQVLPGNPAMRRLCDRLGLRVWHDERDGLTRAELRLDDSDGA